MASRAVVSVLSALIVLAVAVQARPAAAAFAPKKPSDLRAVVGEQSSAACVIDGFHVVDHVQNSDGTIVQFSVPPKSVFVITSWEWSRAAMAGNLAQVNLIVPSSPTAASIVSVAFGVSGANGDAGGSVIIPSGATLKAGQTLCYNGPGFVLVHGFITKDK